MTIVYIDGQNFLYKAADILIRENRISDKQELHTIDIRGVVEKLIGENGIKIRYYGTRVRKYTQTQELTEKTTTIVDSMRRLRNSLLKQKIEFIEAGRLKLRDGDVCRNCGRTDLHLQEKGVDVRICLDMLRDAEQGVDKLILISSDTDLLPPVSEVVSRDKSVVYVGFSDKTTNALVKAASEVQIIRDNEIIEAFDKLNPPSLKLHVK